MNEFEFDVPNFKKYNPRNDVKHNSWFRASNTTYYDAKFSQLGVHSKALWFFFVAEISRNDGKPTSTSCKAIARLNGFRINNVRAAVLELERNQMLVVSWRDASATLRTNKTRRTRRTLQDREDIATAVANPQQENDVEKKSHWLVDMWNEFGAKLPKAHTPISSVRLKKIQTRIKERPDPELWKAAIIRLAESNFANGLNDRAWVAGFDFILQTESLDKILEGKYDNRRAVTQKERHLIEQTQRLLGES